MMTRKDYVEFAKILNEFQYDIEPQVFEDLLADISEYFKSDNKNFDASIFRNAVLS